MTKKDTEYFRKNPVKKQQRPFTGSSQNNKAKWCPQTTQV